MATAASGSTEVHLWDVTTGEKWPPSKATGPTHSPTRYASPSPPKDS